MKILPVLDLKDGQVVHAKAGNREQYRPLQSLLCDSAQPLQVAQSLANAFGFSEFYIADLDAILLQRPQLQTYSDLSSAGFKFWLDGGFRSIRDIETLHEVDAVSTLVFGTETLTSLSELEAALQRLGPTRCVVSVDLFDGQLRTRCDDWQSATPLQAIEEVMCVGVQRLILLDLAHVGATRGLGTLTLAQQVRQLRVSVEITVGGGIRSAEQLELCAETGCDYSLLATALHNGQLTPQNLKPWL